MIKINADNESFKKFLKSISEAIAICTIDGKIKFANSALAEFIGYSEKHIMNMNIQDLIKDWNNIKNNMCNQESLENIETSIKSTKNILKLNLNIYTLYKEKMNDMIFVVVFKEAINERKLAQRLLKGKAIYTFDKIIGKNKDFLKIIEYAKKISNSKSTILITGESGTGKEIFAQAIHNYSNRKEHSFVAVNCGAIPVNLIESELFGYDEGAFTGAKKGGNAGKFEMADGGTIFLDEIGEMSVEMQVRLLRVIEEGIITRVGGSKQIPINVRIIAATNKNLEQEVENENFRRDLFYRLNVIPMCLPPLRYRKDDIYLLVDYYMDRISKKLNKKKIEITDSEMDKLLQYDWPGNIRELQNFIELSINMEFINTEFINSPFIDTEDKKIENYIHSDDTHNDMNLEIIEKKHIEKMIKKFEGNITLASKAMGIGRNTLYRKMKKYDIIVLY